MSYRDDTETRLTHLEYEVSRLCRSRVSPPPSPLKWWYHLVIVGAVGVLPAIGARLTCNGGEEAPEPAYDWRTDQTAVACHAACTAAGFRGVRYEPTPDWPNDATEACLCASDEGLVVMDVYGQRLQIENGGARVKETQR